MTIIFRVFAFISVIIMLCIGICEFWMRDLMENPAKNQHSAQLAVLILPLPITHNVSALMSALLNACLLILV